MLTKLIKTLSFNRRFVAASLFYIGLGLILFATTPDIPSVQATDGCGGCPDGMVCVQVGEGFECQCPDE